MSTVSVIISNLKNTDLTICGWLLLVIDRLLARVWRQGLNGVI